MKPMNVGKLIAELKKFNPKSEVFIAADSEGNSFSEVDELQLGAGYSPEYKDAIIIWPGGFIEPDEEG